MIKKGEIKITTLDDNTSQGYGILGEHGFSVLVETRATKLLVDTGASPFTVVHNATVKGISLALIDAIILSHGHWDHTGGLESVLSTVGKEIPVYAHPAIWQRKGTSETSWQFSYAGIQFNRENLERLGACFVMNRKPTWLTKDIVITGEEEMTTDFERVDSNLAIKRDDGTIVPDPMEDDQSLIIRTEAGLVIILGCAHRGVINIIRYAMKLTGNDRVFMVIGGTHLAPASHEQLLRTIQSLREIGVKNIGVSHCTGQNQAAALASEFGSNFFYNNSGNSIII
jgi:7,8-dihydropterin-6-yl-methyl-4-(beta-D-ribofuranosyl)aminobenzene 5'-phosphate synthase